MKKVVITGGSSGLGYEIAKLLLNKDISVVNLSRKKCELDIENIKTDLSNSQEITNSIETIRKDHTDLDLLILNAGIMPKANVGEIDFDINEIFDINTISVIKIVNALIDIIKKNEGDIVVVASTASFRSDANNSVYNASKHAVCGFVKTLQAELKGCKSRVIGFYPGGFNSNLRGGVQMKGYMDPEDLAKLLVSLVELPKGLEVSEIVVNKNKPALL